MTTQAWLAAPFAAAGDTARFGAARERVEALLSAQRTMWKDEPGSWTVIPLDRLPTVFVLVARDTEGERRGREVVGAFVGPAVARLDAAPLMLTTAASADTVLRSQGISHVIPLIQNRGSAELLTALERLVSVRSTQPAIRRDIVPPLSFLLRDYWLALQQGDSTESARLYARIEQVSDMGADNLRFLRVDRLASLGRWQELAGLPEFRDLSRARRPRQISEELLAALWQTQVASGEGVASAAQAVQRFTAAGLADEYQSLLRSVDVPKLAAARRLVAVSASLDAQDDRIGRLFDTADEAERKFITDLMSWRDGTDARATTGTLPVNIDELLELEDWEGVLQSAEANPGDPHAATAAVRAAYDADDSEFARRAIALISLIPEAELSTSRTFRHNLSEVRKSAADECASWAEWLRRVGNGESWGSAAEVLRAESGEWDITEFTSNDAAQEAGAALLDASGNINADQVLHCLDLLCDLARRMVGRMMGTPLVDAILMVIGEQVNPSHQVREAFRGLLEPLLDAGPAPEQYVGYVELVRDLWGKVHARATFDWGLDLADLLLSMQCPDQAIRQLLVQDLMSWAAANQQALEYRQVVMTNAVAEYAGLGAILTLAPVAPGEGDIWARLAGTRIGLYSLLPKAGSHLKEQLERLVHAQVIVDQNSDHVATTALTRLAASADYMVVDTWHAKHSATIAIDSVLSRDQQILPRGGGVGSFLAALQERIESNG